MEINPEYKEINVQHLLLSSLEDNAGTVNILSGSTMLIDNNAQNAPTESTLVKANISVSEFKVNIALEEDTKTSKVFVSVILKHLFGMETHALSALSLITLISIKRSA